MLCIEILNCEWLVMDSSDSSGDREAEAFRSRKSSRVFSDQVRKIFSSLYARGMTGRGKKHSVCLNIARERIGLSLSQIKVLKILLHVAGTTGGRKSITKCSMCNRTG